MILDRLRRIIAVLAGRPKALDWDDVTREAIELMGWLGENLKLTGHEAEENRRGDLAAKAYGSSFGGGQKVRCSPY